MLSRRDANKRLGKIGALAAVMSAVGLGTGCGEKETVVEKDALELQKEQGWNFGSSDQALDFPGAVSMDSTGSLGWSVFLEPTALLRAYQPRNTRLQPFVVPTLVQSLSQNSLRGQIRPIVLPAMRDAYARGLGMRDILSKSQNASSVLLICDLPGPESVAFAAALADTADVILTFDNWPHPLGVVPSHHTIGALVYYAQEVTDKTAKRPENAPAVFLLDSGRLTPYSDASDKFDNRYVARIPTADNLQTLGITSVLYAVSSEYQKTELDDLNDDFALYKDKGIAVSMLPLNHFMKPAPGTVSSDTARTATGSQPAYYYGGGSALWPWFFMHYAMMSPYRGFPAGTTRTTPPVQRPNYAPVRRPTVFSSRNVGGTTGIGKQKPTGFGRVSTSVSGSGRTSRVRSGSFSRSRSGYSS
jgi:hypothetical protein